MESRNSVHSGPSQLLPTEAFPGADHLGHTLSYSLAPPSATCVAEWKVRVTVGGEVAYFKLTSDTLSGGDWREVSHDIALPAAVLGANEVKLYLEVDPKGAYGLDDVSLTATETGGDWEEEANARIDVLRRRNVSLQIEGMEANQLVLEVHQVDHAFPFGTAVKSPTIAACWEAGEDDAYCSFVRDNFSWLVDTYRMKWKPSEPTEGQLETEVRCFTLAGFETP